MSQAIGAGSGFRLPVLDEAGATFVVTPFEPGLLVMILEELAVGP
ncbi:MAG: hypothetical protein Q8Q88_23830 [Phenylobacterium sp.]|nr:hypothetical protein [Phenylobacterium sp.]MDP3750067.1 hypothetical protein [Phenylobacterium sp.]